MTFVTRECRVALKVSNRISPRVANVWRVVIGNAEILGDMRRRMYKQLNYFEMSTPCRLC